MEWISREFNNVANKLSRIDCNDYMVDPACFARVESIFGPHNIDRFASSKTKQFDRFCSRFLNPGCEAVDAFTVSWAEDCNWLFPPPYLIPRVLRNMTDSRGTERSWYQNGSLRFVGL